jgi:hypothetical protein
MPTGQVLAGKKFDVFTSEPLLLSRVNPSRRRRLWLIGIPVATIALLFEGCALYGTVTMPHLGGQFCADFTRFLGFAHPECDRRAPTEHRFPLLRDLPSLSAIIILLVTPALIQRQWSAFEDLLPGMERDGSLGVSAKAGALSRITDEIARTNARFGRIRSLAPLLVAVSVICVSGCARIRGSAPTPTPTMPTAASAGAGRAPSWCRPISPWPCTDWP